MDNRFKSSLLALISIMLSAVLVSACGGGGSGADIGVCVVQSPLGALYDHCSSNYEQSECSQISDSTFHSGQSCSALGYTLQCPGDPPTVTRMHCP